MRRDLLVTHIGQLVTMRGPAGPRAGPEMAELGIVRDAALLVRAGRIVAAGPPAEVEPLTQNAENVDAGGRAVLPGFVDAHTHLIFAGSRVGEFEQRTAGVSYQQIAAAGGGIRSTVRSTRAASQQELNAIGERHAHWFLSFGTTTVEAKSGYGLSLEEETKILLAVRHTAEQTRLRTVPTFLGAHEVPEEFSGRADEYVSEVVTNMLPRIAEAGLARYCDVFCERGVFTVDQAERVLRAARDLGLGIRIHADQFTDSGASALAARLGAKTADHLEHTTPASIALLKAAGVQPVLLPGSVYTIGSQRYPAAREMIAAGLPVVLATDFNPGSSPVFAMPMILSLACTQMKMSPAEALTAATINAAWSLDLGSEAGSLEPGKSADFVLHEAEDYRDLAYWFGGHRPHCVYRAGERVA